MRDIRPETDRVPRARELPEAAASMQIADPELMRAINRLHVLETIRRREPIARVEIGEHTRLSRATVSAIIGALLEEGLVAEIEEPPSAGREAASGRGRPRIMLRMNPNAAYVAGVKISMHQISVMVTNLRADVLTSFVLPMRTHRLGAAVIADIVEDSLRRAVADAGLEIGQIAGVGIGLPGFIDAVAGICHWSPIFGNEPVHFAALVQERLGVSTRIENDANLVTLAERWFGHGQDVDDFIVITVEHGVGMGVFLNGELYRGHHGLGAEFGHAKHDRHGPPCRCGQSGCIEAYAADYAILRDAAMLIELGDVEDALAADRAIRQVTELAFAGDRRFQHLFERAGEVLGLGIANLINVLNPARVILSGAGMRAGRMLGDPLIATIRANVLAPLADRLDIVMHEWSDEVWARGAASLIVQEIYRTPWSLVRRPLVAVEP